MVEAPCRPAVQRRYRLRRALGEAASVALGLVLLIWSLLPIYNMLLIALDPDEGNTEFAGLIWPPEPSLESFRVVLVGGYWFIAQFWHKFGNSLYIGLMTMALTMLIRSFASLSPGPTSLRHIP